MEQLDTIFYSRQEIAEVLSVNIADTGHFARNVKSTLDRWGYAYEYSRRGVTITKRPETPEERLAEILIRKLGINVQVNARAFACFLCAFADIDGFCSMPWEERAAALISTYGVSVNERTLRNWCKKLIEMDYINKDVWDCSYWKTTEVNGVKHRMPIEAGDAEMTAYHEERRQRVEAKRQAEIEKGSPPETANRAAFSDTMREMWEEYHYLFYSCPTFQLTAIDSDADCLYEIYQLTEEIVAKGKAKGDVL